MSGSFQNGLFEANDVFEPCQDFDEPKYISFSSLGDEIYHMPPSLGQVDKYKAAVSPTATGINETLVAGLGPAEYLNEMALGLDAIDWGFVNQLKNWPSEMVASSTASPEQNATSSQQSLGSSPESVSPRALPQTTVPSSSDVTTIGQAPSPGTYQQYLNNGQHGPHDSNAHSLTNKVSCESFASTAPSEHLVTPRQTQHSFPVTAYHWDEQAAPGYSDPNALYNQQQMMPVSPRQKNTRALSMKPSMPSLAEEGQQTELHGLGLSHGMNAPFEGGNGYNVSSHRLDRSWTSSDGTEAQVPLNQNPNLLPPAEINDAGHREGWNHRVPTFPSQQAFDEAAGAHNTGAPPQDSVWLPSAVPSNEQKEVSQEQHKGVANSVQSVSATSDPRPTSAPEQTQNQVIPMPQARKASHMRKARSTDGGSRKASQPLFAFHPQDLRTPSGPIHAPLLSRQVGSCDGILMSQQNGGQQHQAPFTPQTPTSINTAKNSFPPGHPYGSIPQPSQVRKPSQPVQRQQPQQYHSESVQHNVQQQYNGQQTRGQQHPGQQNHAGQLEGQQYSAQQFSGQQYNARPFDGQQYNAQEFTGQPYNPQQFNDQPCNFQQNHAQSYSAQPPTVQQYKGQQHSHMHGYPTPQTDPRNAPPPNTSNRNEMPQSPTRRQGPAHMSMAMQAQHAYSSPTQMSAEVYQANQLARQGENVRTRNSMDDVSTSRPISAEHRPRTVSGCSDVLTTAPLVHPTTAQYNPPTPAARAPVARQVSGLPSPKKRRASGATGAAQPGATAPKPRARKPKAAPQPFCSFINFTPDDREEILNGVAPSGSQKRKREVSADVAGDSVSQAKKTKSK